jgi:hypothetical protein
VPPPSGTDVMGDAAVGSLFTYMMLPVVDKMTERRTLKLFYLYFIQRRLFSNLEYICRIMGC